MQRLNRFLVPALGLVLLLASTAGLVDHDHGLSAELAAYACSVDHQDGGHGYDSGLHAAGDEHQHVCPGCHLTSNRLLVVAAHGITAGRAATLAVAAPPWPSPRRASWAHPPRRGPPA